MQLAMWPLSAALLVVGSFFPVAVASASLDARGTSSQGVSIWRRSHVHSSRQVARAPAPAETGAPAVQALINKADPTESVEDDQTSLIGQQLVEDTPCSCDCCQVQKLLPMEFVLQPNGKQITSRCWKAAGDLNSGGGDPAQAICPSQCSLSADNSILTSTETGEVDYNRFCNYNCQPVTDAVGTGCVLFSKKFQDEAKSSGGNGKEVYPVPVLGLDSGYAGPLVRTAEDEADGDGGDDGAGGGGDGAPKAAAKKAAVDKAKAENEAEVEKLKITYDMRKLVAERLRSEAGANVASAAAAAERVRINEWTTKKNTALIKKLRTKYAAIGGKVEENVAGVEADKNEADEAETKTKKNLAESRMFATTMVKDVRKLADEAIKKAVEPCSEMAARNRAQAKGLDKPKDWVKVVAARAANPYQAAVTTAVMRTSEYKNLADGLMDQAYGAQKQANTLISHVNVLEAQGDVIGATIEKKQVTNLLARAKSLSAEAAGYWNTAQSTRNTIPKWQMAAAQAAAYAAWEYSNNAKAFR